MRYLQEIESVPLESIEWYKNEKRVYASESAIEGFKFTGLNNRDFAKLYMNKFLHDGEGEKQDIFFEFGNLKIPIITIKD